MSLKARIGKISMAGLTLSAAALLLSGCGQKQTKGVVIKNRGSDTLVQVATAWAEVYKNAKPDVTV